MKFNIYGKPNCSSCVSAKQLLESKGIEYNYLVLGKDYYLEKFMSFNKAHKSLPLITINTEYDGVPMEDYVGDLNKLQQMLCGG